MDRPKPRAGIVHYFGGRKQLDQKTLVHVDLAFVLRGIAKPVCLVEDPPDPGAQAQGMLQRRENMYLLSAR